MEGKRLQMHLLPMVLQVLQALLHVAFLFSWGSLSVCDCLLARLRDVAEEEGVRVCSETDMVMGHLKQKICVHEIAQKIEYKRHNTQMNV